MIDSTSTSPGSQAQNTFSTPSFDPPTFSSIVTPDLVSSTIDTPTENSSDGRSIYCPIQRAHIFKNYFLSVL